MAGRINRCSHCGCDEPIHNVIDGKLYCNNCGMSLEKLEGGLTMAESELKPCPFCGEKASLVKVRGGLSFGKNFRYAPGCVTGKCMGHWVSGKGFYSEAEAIEAWNRRADDEV